MALNRNLKYNKNNNKIISHDSRSFSETARLLGYKKVNTTIQSNKNNKKPAILGISQSSLDINWDDPIEIETRDSDSIHSESIPRKPENKKPFKFYTFYDYINKNQKEKVQNKKTETKKSSTYTNRKDPPEYIYKLKKEIEPEIETLSATLSNSPDLKYSSMPISSGFGGYTTTTTRRKVQPMNNQTKIHVMKQKQTNATKQMIKADSEDELKEIIKPIPKAKTLIIDSDPEEEIVHVIHKPRKSKPPKEQIFYVDEDDFQYEESEITQPQKLKQEVVYVNEPESPQPLKLIHTREPKQVVYAIPKRQTKPQIMYVKEPSAQYIYQDIDQETQNYIYANNEYNQPTKTHKLPPSYVYYESPRTEKKLVYADQFN